MNFSVNFAAFSLSLRRVSQRSDMYKIDHTHRHDELQSSQLTRLERGINRCSMSEAIRQLASSPESLDTNVVFSLFNDAHNELKYLISNATSKQDLILIKTKVSDLSNSIQTCVDRLPSYDQRRYSEHITALLKMSEDKSLTFKEKKFNFKSRSNINSEVNRISSESKSHTASNSTTVPSSNETETPIVDSLNNHKLTINQSNKHALIQNITSSIIVTNAANSQGSIHLKNSTRSIIHLVSDGPTFVNDLTNVILIVKCHQLRLHNIRHSTILLSVGNNKAIIENCDHLKIGKYPFSENKQTEQVEIDDFNWPTKLKKNTHFDFIEEDKSFAWINDFEDGQLSPNIQEKLKLETCNLD